MKNKTDLYNPTRAQIKYRNRLWANALLANKKKARTEMYDEHGGRCCLAVAQDVAISCGVENIDKKVNTQYPHMSVASFFGWDSNVPDLKYKDVDGFECTEEAAQLNDGILNTMDVKFKDKGLSHKQIAECVLNTFVRPANPKYTFKV